MPIISLTNEESEEAKTEEEFPDDEVVDGNTRIIGGDPVRNFSTEAPFLVVYRPMRGLFPELDHCSGILLTKRIVVTVARCFNHLIKVLCHS